MNIQRDRGRKPAFTRPIENLKPAEEAPPLRLSRSRVTPLSWAWISYKFKYSNEASFNLAETREIARLKSAVELFIFCSGGRVLSALHSLLLQRVILGRVISPSIYEALSHETPRGLVVPRFPTHLGDTFTNPGLNPVTHDPCTGGRLRPPMVNVKLTEGMDLDSLRVILICLNVEYIYIYIYIGIGMMVEGVLMERRLKNLWTPRYLCGD